MYKTRGKHGEISRETKNKKTPPFARRCARANGGEDQTVFFRLICRTLRGERSGSVASASAVVVAASTAATVAVQKNERDNNDPEALAVLQEITEASHFGYILLKKSR